MNNISTLLILSDDTPDAVITSHAQTVANTNGHLRCLLVGPSPIIPTYIYSVPPYGIPNVPDDWGPLVVEARKAKETRAKQISDIVAKQGASCEVTHTICPVYDVSHIVANLARTSDVAIIAQDLRDSPDIWREVVHGVLMESPIGLMLNTSPTTDFRHAFLAWDGSSAAARAAHVALPLMKEADQVTIACFDPDLTGTNAGTDPGTDVAGWLSHHGCNVTLSQYPSGGVEIGECIQNRATEAGADIVVCGAYGHSRMREAVFGGTTRTLLKQTKLPVFLAH